LPTAQNHWSLKNGSIVANFHLSLLDVQCLISLVDGTFASMREPE
jgi:hypothetical protein